MVCSLLLSAAGFGAELPRSERTTVTSVTDAFAQWPQLVDDDQPVRLQGVVTGVMPTGAFRMHDGELGIYVTKSPSVPKLTAGDRIALTGVLRKGGFSPWVSPLEVTLLGRGEFPIAKPTSFSVLATGAADNQWVEIEGVVRDVQIPEPRDFVVIDLGMPGGNLRMLVTYDSQADFAGLTDAAVRVRGVAAVNVNAQKHVVEPSFRVPSFSEITVLRPGHPDPFAQPLVPLQLLMRGPFLGGERHRVHTRGVVTRQLTDTVLFVRDGDMGLKVETRSPQRFQPGDVVEAAGFPAMEDGLAVLRHTALRRTGSALAPAPAAATLAELLGGTHNSNLVSIRARLVDWVAAGQNVTLVFQTGDHIFKGLLSAAPGVELSLPDKNSLVSVTGVCVISELEDVWFYQPRSFLLLVADRADLLLVQAPPWWTPRRLWSALGITGVILLAAVGWVWALRRQIDGKRAVIEQQARHAAALEERSRIARDLHDTLEQGLTGLSLQMKAMETDLQGLDHHPARARLQLVRQTLRQSRALARNAIRELRAEAVPARLESLIDGLKRISRDWNHSGALTAEVRITGEPRAVPSRIEHHLLGIGTEAMTNAVKHGRAEFITAEVEFRATDIVLRITDNGAGFDPAQQLEQASGCFGLLGMRERAREIRGELHISSQPGQGTLVAVTAPLEASGEVERLDPKSLDREPAKVLKRLEVKPLHHKPHPSATV